MMLQCSKCMCMWSECDEERDFLPGADVGGSSENQNLF